MTELEKEFQVPDRWERMKKLILTEYPRLPWLAKIAFPSLIKNIRVMTAYEGEGNSQYSMTYRICTFKNRDYFYDWGAT